MKRVASTPRLIQLELHGAVGPDEIEDGIFPLDMPLEVEPFLRMREGLPNQSAVALARGQVVAFDN
jgi:hypothetical protein